MDEVSEETKPREGDAPPKGGVELDPGLQARLLEQMHEEREATARRNAWLNWIVAPLAFLALAIGIGLAFSENAEVAFLANFFASALGYLLYRLNRTRIRAFIGLQ